MAAVKLNLTRFDLLFRQTKQFAQFMTNTKLEYKSVAGTNASLIPSHRLRTGESIFILDTARFHWILMLILTILLDKAKKWYHYIQFNRLVIKESFILENRPLSMLHEI